jgi:LmbE family N-acetylglucosaminyl deacetylase
MRKWRRLLAGALLAINQLLSSSGLSRRVRNTSALVFAPHPDDEVLGCGGIIALKAQAGARVKVVVMTDGRASHRTLISEEDLVKMRRAEAKEAAVQLGLVANDYVFLEFEDHRLMQQRDAAIDWVLEIIDRFEPEEVYVPHRRDGISDHVETNWIVREALNRIKRSITLLEYPVWLWNCWPWTQSGENCAYGNIMRRALKMARDIVDVVFFCRARVVISDVLDRKGAALAAYRSQVQRFNGDPRWPVLADVAEGEFLRRFETDFEIFRRTNYRS